jgi:fructose/tagatose bisphosphate aldolase
MAQPLENLARVAAVPVVLQQDHGTTFEYAVMCIRAGFSSIMVDRSTLSFIESIDKRWWQEENLNGSDEFLCVYKETLYNSFRCKL